MKFQCRKCDPSSDQLGTSIPSILPRLLRLSALDYFFTPTTTQAMADPPQPSSTPAKNAAVPIPSRPSGPPAKSPGSRTTPMHLANIPSPASQHRQSLSESYRGMPSSPRAHRQPSLSQIAVQELIDNPPVRNDPEFAGRDWRSVRVSELVRPELLKFVEADTGVEAATNVDSTIHVMGQRMLTCAAAH